MPTRDDVVAFVAPLAGLRWPSPQYIELLMPAAIEPEANRQALSGQSSCALLARAVWRELGCAHPLLRQPYRIGHAVGDVVQVATDLGAWHAPGDGETPSPGDVLLVGDVGHEHVAVLTALDATHGDGMHVASVDGGQGPHGAGIEARARVWPSWSSSWRDVTDLGADRPVRGWADSSRVLAAA